MLAAAAIGRIAYVALLAPDHPQLKAHLPLVPAEAWVVALVLVLGLAAGPGRRLRRGD